MAPITSALRRQMTDEGARVTADRDEFCAVCDAVDAIHARRLRALDASTRRVDEICAENEGLRRLVSELWVSCPVHDDDCDECRHKGGRTGCELYDRMMELGVDG